MISSPTTRPLRPSTAHGYTSSQPSGAPSDPCLGASFRVLSADRITPIGRSSTGANASDFALVLIVFKPKPPFLVARTAERPWFGCSAWSRDTSLHRLATAAILQSAVPAHPSCLNPPHAGDQGRGMERRPALRALASPRIAPSIPQFQEFDTAGQERSQHQRFLQIGFGHRRPREREPESSALAPWAIRCRRGWHRREFRGKEKDG